MVAKSLADSANVLLYDFRIHIRLGPEGLKDLILRDETFRVFHEITEYVKSPGVRRRRSSARHRQWFKLSSRNGWNTFIACICYQNPFSHLLCPFWIVLSRMVVQRDSFPGCPTQSLFLSLWFSQRVHRQPKALDEPTSGLSVITDNSEVDPPLRTEGVVIMLWPITYRSSATDVR